MANDAQISMRLPADLLERIDRLVPVLARDPANAAWRVSRGSVLRLALIEGLTVLEGRFLVGSPAKPSEGLERRGRRK